MISILGPSPTEPKIIRPRYMGIENEIIRYSGSSETSFESVFREFSNESDYFKSETSIRTTSGNGYYVDGKELEILTPPIAMTKGYATRLTNSLMIGRKRVADFAKGNPLRSFTGYSMHWNITAHAHARNDYEAFCSIAVPFRLFGTTPLSTGIRVRHKNRGIDSVYELLGDSISNPEQINALALLLGSGIVAYEEGHKQPHITQGDIRKDLSFLIDGRYTQFNAHKFTGFDEWKNAIYEEITTLQAQQYLEEYYEWVKPFVQAFGTDDEVTNLEDFIYMRKRLEFDEFKFFSYINANILGNSKPQKFKGKYPPMNISTKETTLSTKISGEECELPIEAQLLGGIVEKYKDHIITFDWECIRFSFSPENSVEEDIQRRIEDIYFDKMINKNSTAAVYDSLSAILEIPYSPEWIDASTIEPNDVSDFVFPKKIKYASRPDIKIPRLSLLRSATQGIVDGVKGFLGASYDILRYEWKTALLVTAIATTLSSGVGGIHGCIVKNSTIDDEIDTQTKRLEQEKGELEK